MPGILSPLQAVALEFTDAVTRELDFTIELGQKYKEELRRRGASDGEAEDLYVEASMVVAGYNMVSRFLVATDVNGLTGTDVPWPLERHEVRAPWVNFDYIKTSLCSTTFKFRPMKTSRPPMQSTLSL